MMNSKDYSAAVKAWSALLIPLAILIALLIAGMWVPDALWPIVHAAPYLIRGSQ
jgi:hypothetical protein